MSYAPDSLDLRDNFFNAIMIGIGGAFNPSNTTFMTKPTGALQYLMSPANRDLASITLQTLAGGKRQARVARIPRGTSGEAITGVTCDTTTSSGYVEQVVDVNQDPCFISWNVTIDVLERYCDDLLAFEREGTDENLPLFKAFNQEIMAKMNGLRLCINERLIAMMLVNAGINVATGVNTPTTVTMLDGTNGAKFELGIQEFIEDMQVNEIPGTPGVIGSGILSRFNTSMALGCCNFSGLDWAAMAASAPWQYYFDTEVGTISGDANEFLVLSPGAVQFVYFNRSVIPARQEGSRHGTTLYGMLADPFVPGLIYDLSIKQNDCAAGEYDPSWTIAISLRFDLAYIPTDAFSVDDDLYGWNGIFRYIAAQS